MKRTPTIIYFKSPNSTTFLPWVEKIGDNRCNGNPDFSGFTEPTLSVLQNSWQAFLDSGEQLEVIPDPEPPAPEPDWTGFNLAMVPPSSQSSFEVWLSQFKPTYQTALTVPAALGQLSETQTAYNTLKTLSAPSAEQIAEWQGIADQFNVGITF